MPGFFYPGWDAVKVIVSSPPPSHTKQLTLIFSYIQIKSLLVRGLTTSLLCDKYSHFSPPKCREMIRIIIKAKPFRY